MLSVKPGFSWRWLSFKTWGDHDGNVHHRPNLLWTMLNAEDDHAAVFCEYCTFLSLQVAVQFSLISLLYCKAWCVSDSEY